MIDDVLLAKEALDATRLSYSPYSHFAVGVAVMLENGVIVKGANQENASYPVGICAERSALATAQNMYPNEPVLAIALAAKGVDGKQTDEIITPCGMCRQAIMECEKRYGKNIRIIMTSATEIVTKDTIKELLPMAFS